MRAPLPYLLSLLLLAAPVAANRNVRGNTGRSATPGTAAATSGVGGVLPITNLNSGLTPVGTPMLAPAIDPSVRLLSPNGSAPLIAAPASADPARAILPAADAPRSDAAEMSGPLPAFAQALFAAGAPRALVEQLYDFLSRSHPGDQNVVYHGLGHSRSVAEIAARMASEAGLEPRRLALVVLAASLHDLDPARAPGAPPSVKATVAYLEQNAEARGLVAAFAARFGFTPAQVAALIKATDFSPVPTRLQEIEQEFQAAAGEAFGADRDWALSWGRRLALADKSAAYVGDTREALVAVRGLASEFAFAAAASGGNATPMAPQVVVANTHKFLQPLRDSADFELLPADLRARFDATLTYFKGLGDGDAALAALRSLDAAPTRGPPAQAILDLARARRYIDTMMSGVNRADDAATRRALLEDWFQQRRIAPGSDRALAVRAELFPDAAAQRAQAFDGVAPALRRHHDSLLRLADELGTTPRAISEALESRRLLADLSGTGAREFETQVRMAMHRVELEQVVARYPDNPRDGSYVQGDVIRQIADTMLARGGDSVEEIDRDGVFLHVDFGGSGVSRIVVNRKPDGTAAEMVFYVTRPADRWVVGGYRRNRGSSPDSASVERLLEWFSRRDPHSGRRIPPGEFVNGSL